MNDRYPNRAEDGILGTITTSFRSMGIPSGFFLVVGGLKVAYVASILGLACLLFMVFVYPENSMGDKMG